MRKVVLILMALAIAFTGCFPNQCEEHYRLKTISDDFSGEIEDCYFQDSHGGRGVPTIILTNGARYYSGTYTLICYAQAGDSIIKKTGTLKYIIKRGDSVTIFYPECGSIAIMDSGKTKNDPMLLEERKCDKRK